MPPVSDRVYRIQAPYEGNAVHLYLIRGARLALIDSGAGDSPAKAVEPARRELGLGWSDLDYLFNTHGHADHAGGNGQVKRPLHRWKDMFQESERNGVRPGSHGRDVN
jgi:glyoxylase-like metal-dependent hydrolase (beta-lactamase superfamily II)